MENFDPADSNSMSFLDDDDLRLFESLDDPELARKILRVKHSDPEVKRLELYNVGDLSKRAWWRLVDILGQNTNVNELRIWYCNLDMVVLGAGLQNNRCIQKLDLMGIDLHDTEKMRNLAPFFSRNPSLKNFTLRYCNLGPASINILSNALSNRLEDTLEELDLSGNRFGDIDLDELCLVLGRSRNLTSLGLIHNGIGLRGCTSIARLLENQESNLRYLSTGHNSIDDESTVILADSLTKNTRLMFLDLERHDGITTQGWSSILKLVCNSSSINDVMNSNHTLFHLGMSAADLENAAGHALGVDNINLLRASVELNGKSNYTLVARRKILWSHARGNFNIGDSSLDTGAMPDILAWLGNYSNETDANLIQYHDPPLPKTKVDIIRLDSMYRIVQSRPSLCG